MRSGEARAARLLRWYPAAWRNRYGEEFAELLVAEIEEHPASWRRTFDVARCGLAARLSLAGLGDGPLREPSLALAVSSGLVVGFGAMAMSIWTQLVTGAHSMPLDSRAAHTAMVVLTASLAMLAGLAVLAAVPVLGAAVRSIVKREGRGLAVPLLTIAAGLAGLVAGGRHLAAHWTALAGTGPGTTHVPDRVTSFVWAETYSISTFWAHPSLLLSVNPARLGWMVASPLALVVILVAGAVVLRRLDLSLPVMRYEAAVAEAAALATLPMLAATAWWVVGSQHDPAVQLRAGSLDLALIVVMAAAAVAARVASRRLTHLVPN